MIGIGECQKKELSEKEKAVLELAKEKEVIIYFLAEELEKLIEKLEITPEEDNKLHYEKVANVCEEMVNTFKKIAMLSREIVELEKELELIRKQPEEKDVYESWRIEEEKQKDEIKWLVTRNSALEESRKRREENERAERLLDELSGQKFGLELGRIDFEYEMQRIMRHLEDEIDMQRMMLRNDLFFMSNMFYEPYYPRYSIRTDWTNYNIEPLLFTLCTDSKGKMDWMKYGWIKLLLKRK